jgi:hypothetical protein
VDATPRSPLIIAAQDKRLFILKDFACAVKPVRLPVNYLSGREQDPTGGIR